MECFNRRQTFNENDKRLLQNARNNERRNNQCVHFFLITLQTAIGIVG